MIADFISLETYLAKALDKLFRARRSLGWIDPRYISHGELAIDSEKLGCRSASVFLSAHEPMAAKADRDLPDRL